MTARFVIFCLLVLQLTGGIAMADAQDPFSSGGSGNRITTTSPPRASFLTEIARHQQHLQRTMATLIRQVKTSGGSYPLFVLLAIAFGYGVVHAAGPGHGKTVAMSYMLSRTPSVATGLLLGGGIAFFHGLSGAVCVLGLHYVLQKSVSGTLATVTQVTQIVSFGLIMLLGIGIAARRGWGLFFKEGPFSSDRKTRGLLPWAVAVGVVPCPGVVMVMLFCLSMDVLALGLLLAVCICLGMATTISFVVITVAMGKAGILSATSTRHAETLEAVVGILSGIVIASLGALFLLATIHAA